MASFEASSFYFTKLIDIQEFAFMLKSVRTSTFIFRVLLYMLRYMKNQIVKARVIFSVLIFNLTTPNINTKQT